MLSWLDEKTMEMRVALYRVYLLSSFDWRHLVGGIINACHCSLGTTKWDTHPRMQGCAFLDLFNRRRQPFLPATDESGLW